MGISWDEILIIVIIIVGSFIWCWKQTDYHIEHYDEIDKNKPLWWL